MQFYQQECYKNNLVPFAHATPQGVEREREQNLNAMYHMKERAQLIQDFVVKNLTVSDLIGKVGRTKLESVELQSTSNKFEIRHLTTVALDATKHQWGKIQAFLKAVVKYQFRDGHGKSMICDVVSGGKAVEKYDIIPTRLEVTLKSNSELELRTVQTLSARQGVLLTQPKDSHGPDAMAEVEIELRKLAQHWYRIGERKTKDTDL
jgi:hypothetical protein